MGDARQHYKGGKGEEGYILRAEALIYQLSGHYATPS